MDQNFGGIYYKKAKGVAFLFLTFLVVLYGLMAQAHQNRPPNQPGPEYFTYLDQLNTGDILKDIAHIQKLRSYPYEETVHSLLNRLYFQLDTHKSQPAVGQQQLRLYREALDILQSVGTSQHLDDFIKFKNKFQRTYHNYHFYNEFLDLLDATGSTLGQKKFNIPSATTLIRDSHRTPLSPLPRQGSTNKNPPSSQSNDTDLPISELLIPRSPSISNNSTRVSPNSINNYEQFLERLHQIQTYMHEHIMDQDEAIQAFINIEHESLNSDRKLPEFIMLQGFPGTGKDSLVRAFLAAKHGYQEAYQEHMFEVPVVRANADLWKVLGSNTGFTGSGTLSPLVRFLVEHSGGRYEIKTEGKQENPIYYVQENKEWLANGERPLEGKYRPDEGILYLNEFHEWSREAKDRILKRLIEHGTVEINAPGPGLAEIQVPITIVAATNEGIRLLSSRENNGMRYGKPLSYEQLIRNWERVHLNKLLLRDQLLASNGAINGHTHEGSKGYSEELLNRLPLNNIVILRPLSPDSLQKITQEKLEILRKKYKSPKSISIYGSLDIRWSDHLVEFISSYHYQAEDNARPIESHIQALVANPLKEAFREQKILPSQQGQRLYLDIQTESDKTSSLLITIVSVETRNQETVRIPIDITEADREKQPLSEARLTELEQLEERLNQEVFGAEEVNKHLAKMVRLNEERLHGRNQDSYSALVFMYLGLSSTGKTETAKALNRILYGPDHPLKVMDFSQVRSIHDLKEKILGTRDHMSNPISSDFMKEYDRNNGRFVIVFDEFANAPLEVLKALYDIFRESVVTTFSDNKPRSMSGVTIILTGNAVENVYLQIPQNIPEIQQMEAMQRVHRLLQSHRSLRRTELEKYFSPALLNRIGDDKIYIFGPLNFRSLRQLTQFKFQASLSRLLPQEGRHGWRLEFDSHETYLNLINRIEQAGFILREQGASIDRYIKDVFEADVRDALLRRRVPIDSQVLVRVVNSNPQINNGHIDYSFELELLPEGHQEPIVIKLKGKKEPKSLIISSVDQLLTAFHEAGHELARQAFFGDKTKSGSISIIPGVTQINGQMVYYSGLASYSNTESTKSTREAVVRHIAVLAAGEVAQTLVTKGQRHDAGKHNDMERATDLAYKAVLLWGLSDTLGTRSVPRDINFTTYVASLPEDEKALVHSEVQKLIEEGRALAEWALLKNYHNAFLPMGLLLAERGELQASDLETFYSSHSVFREKDAEFFSSMRREEVLGQPSSLPTTLGHIWKSVLAHFSFGPSSALDPNLELARQSLERSRDAELLPHIQMPPIANIDDLVAQRRQREVDQVPMPSNIPLSSSSPSIRPLNTSLANCQSILSQQN